MSYYTQLQLNWEEDVVAGHDLSVDQVVEVSRVIANEQGWSEHVLEDLRAACRSSTLASPGFNKLQADGVIFLIQEISRRVPDVVFYAKGSGEAHWDIWLRSFREGQVILERGPFDELEAPIPEELLAAAKAAAKAADARGRKRGWLSRLLGDA